MATDAQRRHIYDTGIWTTGDSVRPLIHYLQQRPENDLPYFAKGGEQRLANYFGAGGVLSLDCSAYQTLLFALAGCADPTGNNYNGYGNSNSMWQLLGSRSYTNPKQANLAALVLFGDFSASPANTVHVACVAEPDPTDPVLLSHGSPAGPGLVKLSDFSSLGDYRFLPISTL